MKKNLNTEQKKFLFKTKKYSVFGWYCCAAGNLRRKNAVLNIKYRDTLFTMLFNSSNKALELYNALYQKNLPEGTPVEIMTLDDVLFVKRKNDVAFLIDGHFLIFVEHQSSLNENMPFRLLLYVVQEYEKLLGYKMVNGRRVSNPNLYKENLIKIPRPEFFVLYNGKEDLTEHTPDGKVKKVYEKTMRLSDAFLDSSEHCENSLELCVKLIDIRYSSGHPILGSKENKTALGEYSYFIEEKENGIKNGMDNKTATVKAVEKCISEGVLRDFLLQHETEVVSMMVGVYDEEMEKKVLCEEAEERGILWGRKEGLRAGKLEGLQVGRISGIISFALDLGYSKEEIISVLQKKLQITQTQAEKYLERYYSNNL